MATPFELNGRNEKKKAEMPRYQRVSFGTGHLLFALSIALWFNYSVTFFTKVLEISPSGVGTIVLVGQVVGAVSAPIVGIWSDHTPSIRGWGRRKPFQLLGTLLGAVAQFFLWFKCIHCYNAPTSAQVLYYSLWAALFQFCWACAQISQLALIPELTSDRNVKVELGSIRFAFTMGSFVAVFVMMWILLERYEGGPGGSLNSSDQIVFWIASVVVIGLGVSLSMLFQVFVHERSGTDFPKLTWYKWLLNTDFYVAIGIYMVSRLVALIPQAYIPLYLTDTLRMDKTSIAKGPLVIFISSFITCFVVKKLYKTIGEELTFFLGLVVVWGSMLWFWVKDPTDDNISEFNWSRDNIYGGTVLFGIGSSMCMVISYAYVAFLVGKYTGSSAYIFGWMNLSDRLSHGITIKIIQSFTTSSSEFYRHVLVGSSFASTGLGLAIISLAIVHKVWLKKRKEKYKRIENMIQTGSFQRSLMSTMTDQESTYSNDKWFQVDNSGFMSTSDAYT